MNIIADTTAREARMLGSQRGEVDEPACKLPTDNYYEDESTLGPEKSLLTRGR